MTTPAAPAGTAAERLVAAVWQGLGVRRAALFLSRPQGDGLVCVATAGAGPATGWVGQTLRSGVGVAGRTVAEGRPVWSPDLLADPRTPISPWLRERLEAEGLRSVLATPLRVGDRIVGALGILDGAGRIYSEDERRRLAELVDAAAGAVWAAFRDRPS
jgi:GAF domain-containing protein